MKVRERPAWRPWIWRPWIWRRVGAAFAVLAAVLVLAGSPRQVGALVPSLIALAAVGTAVWAVRRSHADRAAYEARLTAWAATEAVLAERLHIARDLHDIVSHGLGLITVRAVAARLATGDTAETLADNTELPKKETRDNWAEARTASIEGHTAEARGTPTEPGDKRFDTRLGLAEARKALAEIETISRSATAELRRMLTVLRTTDEAGPRLPVEGLDRLPAVIREAGVTGLRVTLADEPVGEVSQGVQVAICKVVREALHNVARHVGPSDVRVRIYRDGDTVVATVKDSGPDGPWPAAPGAGHGLTGLRERVTGLGGIFDASRVEAGFLVTARIPDSTPSQATGNPSRTTGNPEDQATGNPEDQATGNPEDQTTSTLNPTAGTRKNQTTNIPDQTTGTRAARPVVRSGNPSRTTDNPSQSTNSSDQSTGNPSRTTDNPSQSADSSDQSADSPGRTTGSPGRSAGQAARLDGGWAAGETAVRGSRHISSRTPDRAAG